MNIVHSYFYIFICLFSAVKCISLFGYENEINNYLYKDFNETAAKFDYSSVETKWIEQPIDHFNKADTRKWKMRYLQRLDMWKTGGPIYLSIGGEGKISEGFLVTGTTYQLADETNGAMFLSEHRYYGDNKPFVDFTPENLRFLSSRQALADLARLLKNVKKRPEFYNSKVVVVGGSYAANLATWLKLLYPGLVDAVIASSAPVKAKTDFFEYSETVGANFKKYGSPGCYEKIISIFKEYERKFETADGIKQLKKEEQICPFTDMTKPENKQLFFSYKVFKFMLCSQYGKTKSINEMCDIINSNSRILSVKDENAITWNEKMSCQNYDFYSIMEGRKNSYQYVAWTYQTCTEFGYFQTTSSGNQPFTKNIPIDFFIKQCTALFGEEFNKKRVEKGVQNTNKMYGGLKPNVSKVVFVNGELDPWHRLGILKDISSEAPAILIPKSSHCNDLYPDRDDDPKELKQARKHIKNLVKKWIGAGENAITKPQN